MTKQFAVGDTFTLQRECDRYRPIYYAAVSGDFNPIHFDPEVAALAGLPGTILQGMCTYGWVTEAFIGYLGDPGKVKRVKVRFSKPVSFEDTITFRGEVTAIEKGVLTAVIEAKNQRGEDVLKNVVAEGRV